MHRYSRDTDLVHANDTVAFAAAAVRPGSLVLDVGAADGSVARVLRSSGCRVIGVEPDQSAANAAKEFCEEVVVAPIETLDVRSLGSRFDAILLLDVLEHLRDPAETLRKLRPALSDRGWFVLSVPNASHAGIRLSLLENRFDYRDVGLLDRTHVRFFDHDDLIATLGEAGLAVLDESAIWREFDGTELGGTEMLQQLPELRAVFEQDPHATTYQFLLRAVAADSPLLDDPPVETALVLRERAAQREREVADLERQLGAARAEIQRLTPEAR